MVLAAFRRFAGLLLVLSAATAALGLLTGLAFDWSFSRSISVGFYVIGSFLLVSGFFVGNRGPVRPKGEGGVPIFGPLTRNRVMRWATPEERDESLSVSVVFVALGFVMILIGVAADTRYELY